MNIDKMIQELSELRVMSGRRKVPHKCTSCQEKFLAEVPRSNAAVTSFRTCLRCGSPQRVKATPINPA